MKNKKFLPIFALIVIIAFVVVAKVGFPKGIPSITNYATVDSHIRGNIFKCVDENGTAYRIFCPEGTKIGDRILY